MKANDVRRNEDRTSPFYFGGFGLVCVKAISDEHGLWYELNTKEDKTYSWPWRFWSAHEIVEQWL